VTLDPALLVTPPKGLEVGYVPIVTRQEAGARTGGPQVHRDRGGEGERGPTQER